MGFGGFVEVSKTAFNLFDQNVLLGDMEVEVLDELVVDRVVLGLPS